MSLPHAAAQATVLAAMARRRGSKRTIEERALDEAASPHSQLWTCLMQLWAWGILSSPIVQKLAQAARLSGCSAHDIDTLAQLGASGAQEGNCHRDLLRAYAARCVTPALSPVTCPTNRKVRQRSTLSKQCCLLPSGSGECVSMAWTQPCWAQVQSALHNGRRLLPCP